ncbi:hypothetical protein Hte_009057 [Hypoxylon texense]
MAPTTPDNPDDHYDAGAPLDGGSSPAILAGSDKHFSPTGLEIGVITAVVVIVFASVVGLFVWRSRKNRTARMTDGSPNATSIPIDEHVFHPVESQDSRDSREPVPPPKFEQVTPQAQRGTPSPYPTRVRRGGKRDSFEEHEIATRF